MSVDLHDQLREMCAFIDEEQGPIAVEEVQGRNRAVVLIGRPPGPVPSKRRGWLIAGVAVVVLGLLAPLMLFAGGTESDVATSITLTTALQATTPPYAEGWSRVPHDDAVFGGGSGLSSVTVAGPGLVAVGWNEENPAGWTSVDGITWSRVPHDENVFGAAFMESVTAGGPGLVAVGMDGPWGDGDAAVWTSVDGFTWTRVPHDETVFGGVDSQVILDVTVGGPGLVAVGNDGGRGWWDNNAENTAAVWTSPDGVNWSRVPHDETVFGNGGNPVMLSVTAGGPGLVAVGADLHPESLAETPVWTSPDGITWTRVPDDATVRGALTSVTAGGRGLVAVGSGISEAMTVWTSVDGITWSQVPHDDAASGRWPDWMNGVTVGGPGLLAFGVQDGDAAVWVWKAEED
jgi:hypothetical protein